MCRAGLGFGLLVAIAVGQGCASRGEPGESDHSGWTLSPSPGGDDPGPGGTGRIALLPNLRAPDLNGDGRADLVFRRLDNTFLVSLEQGGDYSPLAVWFQHGGPHVFGQEAYVDIDGDGRDDLVMQGVDNRFWVSRSTGTAFAPAENWVSHGGTFRIGMAQYADLDADGRADLILQGIDNQFWVSRSTGTAFTVPQVWVSHGGEFAAGMAQYADVDGDARADLLFQGLDNQFWVSLSTGRSFTAPESWLAHTGEFVAGRAQYADVDGDGRADLVFQADDNCFEVSLSDGSSFAAPVQWACHGGMPAAGHVHYPDVDGDGRADLVLQADDSVFWVSRSTGDSFATPERWAAHSDGFAIGQALFADSDGDGRDDLVFEPFDYRFEVARSSGTGFEPFRAAITAEATRDLISPLPAPSGPIRLYGYYSTYALVVRDSIEFRDHANTVWTGADGDQWKAIPTLILSGMNVGVQTHDLFDQSYPGGQVLAADWEQRWDRIAERVAPFADRIAFFYLADELYHDYHLVKNVGPYETVTSALDAATAAIRARFPSIPILLVESCQSAVEVAGQLPAAIDWVGHDCYGTTPGVYADVTAQIAAQLAPHQSLVVIPQGAHMGRPHLGGPRTPSIPDVDDQAFLIDNAYQFRDLAIAAPRVIGVLPYQAHDNFHDTGGVPQQWGGMEPRWGSLDNATVQAAFRDIGRSLLY